MTVISDWELSIIFSILLLILNTFTTIPLNRNQSTNLQSFGGTLIVNMLEVVHCPFLGSEGMSQLKVGL